MDYFPVYLTPLFEDVGPFLPHTFFYVNISIIEMSTNEKNYYIPPERVLIF